MNLAIARTSTVGLLLALPSGVLTGASAAEPPADGIYLPTAATQSETDEYTRYELLAPDSGKFRITYEVTATTAGAEDVLQPHPKGQRRERRGRARRDDRQAAALRGRQRRRGTQGSLDARRRPRHRLHQGDARSPRAGERPGDASSSSRLTRTGRATTSTARRSCSTGRSAYAATRSCCPLATKSSASPCLRRSSPKRTAASASAS